MRCKRTLGAAAAALLCVALSARAQEGPIVLDGSFDPSKAGFAIPLVDNNYEITDDLGEFSDNGENLFHSFSQFDIDYHRHSATFSSSASPSRVIARVTQPGPKSYDPGSHIYGTLRCTIEGADLFLLNPWGITFGESAQLDVKGSFHASTADVLRFGEGIDFDARTTAFPERLLSTAEPLAFGFTSAHPAKIGVYHSEGLGVPAGETLSFVGGEFEMVGHGEGLNVEAPGAHVQIAAAGGPADVPVDLAQLDPASLPAATEYEGDPPSCSSCGGVFIKNGAELSVSSPEEGGQPAGSILIRGGRFELASSKLIAEHREDAADAGGAIDVAVNGRIDITDGAYGASELLASTEAQGRGGDLLLSGESVNVRGASSVAVNSTGPGASGSLRISAGTLKVSDRGQIAMQIDGEGPEPVADGKIDIDAETVTVEGGAKIASINSGRAGGSIEIDADTIAVHDAGSSIFTETGGSGKGGDLTLRTKSLDVAAGGQLLASTTGSGEAGRLQVLGADFISLRGVGAGVEDELLPSGIFGRATETATAEASGGGIVIERARILEVDNGAQISSATFGAGSAADLTITADTVTIRGGEEGATVVSAASRLAEGSPPTLGASGNVTISAQTVALVDGGQISVSTAGTRDAGNIEISADDVSISGVDPGVGNPSAVFAQTNAQNVPEGGDGGDITITARQNLRIADGGRVSVSAEPYTDGDAGLITLDVGGTLELASGGTISAFSAAASQGKGGSIAIKAGERVSLAGGSEISASSFGSGNAGKIEFYVPRFESRDSFVTTEAAYALGGEIELHASKSVKLVDSTLTTSVFGEPGDGGNITIGDETIHPELVVLEGSTVKANSLAGRGGTIMIWADALLQSPDSLIQAKAPPGLEGIVEINAPEVALAGDLATLPESFLDASALLTGACEARTARAGSFVVQRRAALPAPPDATVSLASAGLPAVGAAPELPQCPLGEEAP